MMKKHLPKGLVVSVAVISMVLSYGAHAQENRSLNDRFQVFGGAWFTDQDRTFRIEDINTGTGVTIDLENLGLDDSDEVPFYGFLWRISRGWRLEMSGTDVDNSDTIAIDPVVVSGITLVPGGSATASFDTNLIVARLGYAFIANERGDLGFSLGVSYIDAEVSVAGSLGTEATSVNEQVDGFVPTIGLFGGVALSERWSLSGRVSAIQISELGDIEDGSWVDAYGAVVYRPFRNVGFGLGYKFLEADVEGTFRDGGDEFRGKLDWEYDGPVAFIEIGFGALR